jgi:ribosome-binding protein aMBF1 (putative translation factor)
MKQQSKYLENAKFRIENREWLAYSKNIAIRIIAALEARKISKNNLSKKLNLAPERIKEILKGKEDFSLSLIAKISKILEVELISFPSYKYEKPIKKLGKKGDSKKSINETNYLLSSKANAKHIKVGIQQAKEGKISKVKLKDLWK